MSQEELALETQLLLQEVTQATHQSSDVLDADGPVVSEYELAKQALVEKLRRKKDSKRQQLRQINQKRYGFGGATGANAVDNSASENVAPVVNGASPVAPSVSPSKPPKHRVVKLPVAANPMAATMKKKQLLTKLRSQAIKQGSQQMAKLFGYSSHEEQVKHLNKIEKLKILQNDLKEQEEAAKAAEAQQQEEQNEEEDTVVEGGPNEAVEAEPEVEVTEEAANPAPVAQTAESTGENADAEAPEVAQIIPLDDEDDTVAETEVFPATEDQEQTIDIPLPGGNDSADEDEDGRKDKTEVVMSPSKPRRVVQKRRNRIAMDDEDDGNEADSEHDGADEAMDDDKDGEKQSSPSKADESKQRKDKAEQFRRLLRAEAMQQKKRKRLIKHGDFVESEAEEEEDEDVLKIGGLGDFGFGVPQAKTQELKEAEDERNALKLREDDLEGIVDELSDEEKEQQQDIEEYVRQEDEDADRAAVKEVMRHVKEGFGRNRRAFSAGLQLGAEARGRFILNELVAADGKIEAARLGLLESDEELSDDDGTGKKTKSKSKSKEGGENEVEEEEEEDEEAEMERVLRERFLNQPKIYITSSESESDDEEATAEDAGPDKEEVESDEERERQQMKLFSERARINRRMKRMKDLQRDLSQEDGTEPVAAVATASVSSVVATEITKAPTVLPNILLEEDEDSQELMKLLHCTNVAPAAPGGAKALAKGRAAGGKSNAPASRPKLGRFNSYSITASSRTSSSFSRVADNCKIPSASSSTSKGFVFTSFSSDGRVDGMDEDTEDSIAMADSAPASAELGRSQSWNRGTKRASLGSTTTKSARSGSNAKRRKSNLFSVLSSYQCMPQTNSAPM
ncbi:TPA: hypothetical protein N0F65_009162 [Lagenidium giganteum]|uniref:DNA replication checkpoint mediator MRC1 domain-containing protein n=1 Tax=Lagenidium giganteum TaxID=4803 RepID=A0AAV2YP06_9STRA|nr:TPA: hypothetical protein N0F65_009162 [Lagenidium giganteum]